MQSNNNRKTPSTDVASEQAAAEASTSDQQLSEVAIIRNLLLVSTAFLLSFTAHSGTRSLQSSLHPKGNLGNNTTAILSFTAMLSNVVLSTLVLFKFGAKWTLVACFLLRFTFPASNLLPVWYLLYVGAAISGFTSGPLWSAKSTYFAQLGEKYAQLKGEASPDSIISLFFGVFFMIQSGSLLTGNILSSVILQRPNSMKHLASDNDSVTIRLLCGAHYCYEDLDVAFHSNSFLNATRNTDSIYHPTTFQINLLFGIYIVCSLLAVPLAVSIDPIDTSANSKSVHVVGALLATVRHLRNPKEILLMPLSLLSGVTYAFITADYCVGFITCSVGIDNVGYVMMVFGAVSGLASGLAGQLHKYVGRNAIFAVGGLTNMVAIAAMLTWSPAPHSMITLCVFAGLWGVANAIWTSQVTAFIAIVFRDGQKEAAFACNYIWQMGGICFWNALSMFVCLHAQLYIIAAIITIGMAGYTAIELMLRAEDAKQIILDFKLQAGTYRKRTTE